MERVGQVSQLLIYPVKSAAGVAVQSAICTNEGLQDLEESYLRDRRWAVSLITEATGKTIVLSGRQQPRLTLVQPTVKGKTLTLNAPDMPELEVPIVDTPFDNSQVHTYKMPEVDETGEGIDCGDEAAEWYSKFLGKPRVRLIYSGPSMRRRKMQDVDTLGMKHPTAKVDDAVAFADCTPYHLASETSLEDLNSRLDTPITMLRFRPNIVVGGSKPYAEDKWDELHLGQARLRGSWNGWRCTVPTIDPDTGVRDPKKEPIMTLLKYHKGDGKKLDFPGWAIFGRCLLTAQEGLVNVGDEILASKEPSKVGDIANYLYDLSSDYLKQTFSI